MLLHGLPGIDAATPGARREQLRTMSDEALARALVALALQSRDAAHARAAQLAEAAALPLGEVIASPFGLRAIAMAATSGGSSVHLELRADLPWPDEFVADGDAAVQTDPHGYWDRGVLQTGKYRGFFADAPLGIWNPNHMAKWGPHELMHRAVGYFWREGASRWELYLGARLNELVPVVLWYGPDEALRLEGMGWDRAAAAARPEVRPEQARWWTAEPPELAQLASRGVAWMRRGLEHFEREWAAIDEELRTSAPVATPADGLDASSDAIAYVVGHGERLRSDRFATYSRSVCAAGREYESTIVAYRDRVERAFDALLFGEISFEADIAEVERRTRRLQDRAWRLAHHARVPLHRLEAMLTALAPVGCDEAGLAASDEMLVGQAPRQATAAVVCTGHPGDRTARTELADGLASLAPACLAWMQSAGTWDAVVDAFIEGAAWRRATLAARIGPIVREVCPPAIGELWSFELALANSSRGDDVVERLCTPVDELPDDIEAFRSGRLHRSSAFVDIAFCEGDPAPLHASLLEGGEIPDSGALAVRYLIGAVQGHVSVVPLPESMLPIWEAVAGASAPVAELVRQAGAIDADSELPTPEAWLEEWIAAGAVGWMPEHGDGLR